MTGNTRTRRSGIRQFAQALAILGGLAVLGCGSEEPSGPGSPGAAPEALPPPPAVPEAAVPDAPAPVGDPDQEAAPSAAGPGEPIPSPDRGQEDEALAEAVRDLQSSDPEVRADALLEFEPEGAGIRYLTDALRDPNPEVRIAAIEQLEDGESRESIAGLVSALEDPDPEVVIEAIDALEYLDDGSVIADLERLLNHPNEEVREAALDAIEYIGE